MRAKEWSVLVRMIWTGRQKTREMHVDSVNNNYDGNDGGSLNKSSVGKGEEMTNGA